MAVPGLVCRGISRLAKVSGQHGVRKPASANPRPQQSREGDSPRQGDAQHAGTPAREDTRDAHAGLGTRRWGRRHRHRATLISQPGGLK